MKYREIAKKLKKLGCQEIPRRGGGSHRKWYNPENNSIVAIPDWGNKDLKLGTFLIKLSTKYLMYS
ncbi:MAG: type II toxin-antitoxin system HicA family toxin [Crocosphaera sp.]|nr:type II toxin-antitoxin system HicA family toxin [Crocosphaera sp.]